MSEPMLPVPLTLEESGWLCHLMMGNEKFRAAILVGSTDDPIIMRWRQLYFKLSKVNDQLMGKEPS